MLHLSTDLPRKLAAGTRHWFLKRRDDLLASPDFHRRVLRYPFGRWVARRRARELFDIAAGFVYSQVLTTCVELDLFERLAIGPLTTLDLAIACDIPEEAMQRFLAAATELRLLQRGDSDQWRLGELGAASLGNPGIAAMSTHNRLLYQDLIDPVSILQNRSQTQLGDYWAYASKPGYSESSNAARYSELMARSQSFVADDVLAQCPLWGRRQLMDVGGGSGLFAAEALSRFPDLRARVFDLPEVAKLASQRFQNAGMSDRAEAIGGDMFGAEMPAGADVVSLIRILHDHDDEQVMRLLRAVRSAISSDGLLLVAEPMAQTASAPGVGAYFELYLWAMRSGRPRSFDEIRRMLEAAGFADIQERPTFQPLLVRVLTARPGEVEAA
ncbi:MAG: methyltransferase [Congregibacter sp.]